MQKISEYETELVFGESYIELFAFKKNNDLYQLVSRTPPNYEGFEIFDFELVYDDLIKNITMLGVGKLGSYFEYPYILKGALHPSAISWDILLLEEDDYIRNYILDESRRTVYSENIDAKLHHKYSSKFKINKEKNEEYFPIEIKYEGNILNQKGNVSPKNGLVRLLFDKRKKYICMMILLMINLLRSIGGIEHLELFLPPLFYF